MKLPKVKNPDDLFVIFMINPDGICCFYRPGRGWTSDINKAQRMSKYVAKSVKNYDCPDFGTVIKYSIAVNVIPIMTA